MLPIGILESLNNSVHGIRSRRNVYTNSALFAWTNGIIPYQFDVQNPLDDIYKDRLLEEIGTLNENLQGCVVLR